MEKGIDHDFNASTSIQKSGRTTLYSTIINNNENVNLITRRGGQQSPISGYSPKMSGVALKSAYRTSRLSSSFQARLGGGGWGKKGLVISSNHLLRGEFAAKPRHAREASDSYLPSCEVMIRKIRASRKAKLGKLDPLTVSG